VEIGEEHEKQTIEPIKDPLKRDGEPAPEPVREEPIKPRKEPVKV
jgi:hypothetical protein